MSMLHVPVHAGCPIVHISMLHVRAARTWCMDTDTKMNTDEGMDMDLDTETDMESETNTGTDVEFK